MAIHQAFFTTGGNSLNSGNLILPGSLLAYYDVGNSVSYPGSGSNFTNLVNTSQVATIVSPNYSTNNGGILSLSTSSYINLPVAYAAGRSEITVCMYLNTNNTTANQHIYDEQFSQFWQFSVNYGTWYTRDTSTGSTGARNNDISSGMTTGAWIYMCYVYSVSGAFKRVYRNGTLISSSTTSIDALTTDRSPSYATIGFPSDGSYYTGSFGEIHIYGVALSQAQIQHNLDVTRYRYNI